MLCCCCCVLSLLLNEKLGFEFISFSNVLLIKLGQIVVVCCFCNCNCESVCVCVWLSDFVCVWDFFIFSCLRQLVLKSRCWFKFLSFCVFFQPAIIVCMYICLNLLIFNYNFVTKFTHKKKSRKKCRNKKTYIRVVF